VKDNSRLLEHHQRAAPAAPVEALKIKAAGQYLGGVAPITIRRLIKRGLIKPNRALRHILIPVAELDRFLAGGQQ
jgi:Helix-turn-helix domain